MRSVILLLLALVVGGVALTIGSPARPPTRASDPSPGATSTGLEAGNFKIDPVHSAVLFRIRHMDVAYFYGRFAAFSGKVVLDDDPAKCSVEVEFESASVDTNHDGRDRHVRSPDFLDAVQFPTISFRSSGVKVKDEKERVYSVKGDLELHGETQEITVDMKLIGAKQTRRGYKAGFEGRTVIDRREFGITTYPDMLGDEVTLIFAFELSRE